MLSGPTSQAATSQPIRSMVILLHGYGASGDDLIDLAYSWQDNLPHTLFWAPNAPHACEINPFGYQWFGLQDLSPFNVRKGLDVCTPVIARAIQAELTKHQLSTANLILVGFSQGAMLAMDLMFHLPGLKGLIGYAGAFVPPLKATLSTVKPEILLIHGMADTVVPFPALSAAQTALNALGATATTHAIPNLAHGIDAQGIHLGGQFLTTHLNEKDTPHA